MAFDVLRVAGDIAVAMAPEADPNDPNDPAHDHWVNKVWFEDDEDSPVADPNETQ